jgi:phosphoribosylformylglycinamidine synthase
VPRFKAVVDITHLPGILDPQGATIERALPQLGFEHVSDVKVGKTIHLTLDADSEAGALDEVRAMCERLLANPVIEAYEIKLSEAIAS